MTVELQFLVPAPDLADHLSLFYHFRTDLPLFEDVERAGLAQLRFQLRGTGGCYRFADGHEQAVSDMHLLGPTTGSTHSAITGPAEIVGVGLNAAGWAALVRSDASSLVNRAADCADRFEGCDEALSAMRGAGDIAGKIACVERYLRRLIARRDGDAVHFMRQVDAWLAGDPSPDLKRLEAVTGLSRRQVERRCNALYGAPPKVLARKYRALRAAVALVQDGESVDDLLSRGFYDQSHLIREVKHFTGATPRQLRANPSLLAQLTIAQRSALAGRVSPAISGT